MTAAYLLVMSSVLGQYPYSPAAGSFAPAYGIGPGYGYGNGYYGRTPLQNYDPMRYQRFYNGEGYYTFVPPAIENPEVINLRRTPTSGVTPTSSVAATSGTTGVVLALNEPKKEITLKIPAGTSVVSYGPTTHFVAADGDLPVIKTGNLINVNQSTITILRRSQK
jgi:hypothetical protein